MKGEDLLELLKWVGLVFAAGFVGYFGKSLAKNIIHGSKNSGKKAPPNPQLEKEKDDYKLEKKKLKQQQKERKKRDK